MDVSQAFGVLCPSFEMNQAPLQIDQRATAQASKGNQPNESRTEMTGDLDRLPLLPRQLTGRAGKLLAWGSSTRKPGCLAWGSTGANLDLGPGVMYINIKDLCRAAFAEFRIKVHFHSDMEPWAPLPF